MTDHGVYNVYFDHPNRLLGNLCSRHKVYQFPSCVSILHSEPFLSPEILNLRPPRRKISHERESESQFKPNISTVFTEFGGDRSDVPCFGHPWDETGDTATHGEDSGESWGESLDYMYIHEHQQRSEDRLDSI